LFNNEFEKLFQITNYQRTYTEVVLQLMEDQFVEKRRTRSHIASDLCIVHSAVRYAYYVYGSVFLKDCVIGSKEENPQ